MIQVGEYGVIVSFREKCEDLYYFDVWSFKNGEKSSQEDICYNKSKSEIITFNNDSIINEEFLLKEISKFIKDNYWSVNSFKIIKFF